MQINHYITTLRPKQWLKNGLILFPAFFGLSILEQGVFIDLMFTFIGFCLLASAIYVFNDLSDVKGDLLHPAKKKKPIASGKISKQHAFFLCATLLITGVSIITYFCYEGIYYCLVYVFINLVYSFFAKHIPILDLLLLSLGYLIRIYLGAQVAGVPVSWWLSLLTCLMAIYILVAKRKDDVLNYQKTGIVVRKHIHFYKKINFKGVLYGLSLLILGFYTAYVFSDSTYLLFKTHHLWITIPFAFLGLFSFTKEIVKTTRHIEPISMIVKNKVIVVSLVVWIIIFGGLIYG